MIRTAIMNTGTSQAGNALLAGLLDWASNSKRPSARNRGFLSTGGNRHFYRLGQVDRAGDDCCHRFAG